MATAVTEGAAMRFLGVDYGTKRVGLAVAEDPGLGAYPLTTLHRSRSLNHDLGEIVRLAKKEEIDAMVVGLPVNADGTEGPAARNATQFARSLLKHTTLPVYLFDEFLTTAEAEEELLAADVSRRKRREVIDRMAAVHLLEGFLRARRENKIAPPLERKPAPSPES
ncbi:MAG: Holliday junction resolvase RuvX [Capsulimonadales bacterium]|nr:Holliday junction resolvase RuvX [Capsulimonadales bacterium]